MLNYDGYGWRKFSYAGLFLLCLTFSGFAQISDIPDSMSQTGLGGANSIIGTVFGPSGLPLESRVRIRISTMTVGDRISTTNEKGSFAFKGLPTGTYTVTIEKEKDFEPYSHSVDLRHFRGGPPQIYTLNIRLEYKQKIESKPGVLNAEFASVPKSSRDHYDNALEIAKNGDSIRAIEILNLAVKEYPAFSLAFNEIGVQYLKLRQFESADEAFIKALKIDPSAKAAIINRGIANVLMKRYGEAVPILRKAIEVNEQSAVAHYFLGQSLANLGLFDDAEQKLRASLLLGHEEMREAHRILAIIYTAKGDKLKAARELEAYLRLAPTTPDADQIRSTISQLKEGRVPIP